VGGRAQRASILGWRSPGGFPGAGAEHGGPSSPVNADAAPHQGALGAACERAASPDPELGGGGLGGAGDPVPAGRRLSAPTGASGDVDTQQRARSLDVVLPMSPASPTDPLGHRQSSERLASPGSLEVSLGRAGASSECHSPYGDRASLFCKARNALSHMRRARLCAAALLGAGGSDVLPSYHATWGAAHSSASGSRAHAVAQSTAGLRASFSAPQGATCGMRHACPLAPAKRAKAQV